MVLPAKLTRVGAHSPQRTEPCGLSLGRRPRSAFGPSYSGALAGGGRAEEGFGEARIAIAAAGQAANVQVPANRSSRRRRFRPSLFTSLPALDAGAAIISPGGGTQENTAECRFQTRCPGRHSRKAKWRDLSIPILNSVFIEKARPSVESGANCAGQDCVTYAATCSPVIMSSTSWMVEVRGERSSDTIVPRRMTTIRSTTWKT